MLDRKNVKGMLKGLKDGEILWYAPDQDYGRGRNSTFAPLFSVKDACNDNGDQFID